MRFVPITKDNFPAAIAPGPKRTQYRFARRETVLYSLSGAYTASRPDEAMPFVIEDGSKLHESIALAYTGAFSEGCMDMEMRI